MTTAEILAQPIYTPAEAAPMCRMKLRTLREWIRTGKVKVSPGHRKFIPAEEVARLRGQTLAANGRQ